MCEFIYKDPSSTKPGETPQRRLYQLKRNPPVMVRPVRLLDCVTGCTALWPDFILSASVRMLLGEVTLEQVDWVQQVALPWGGRASSNRSEAWGGRKGWASCKQDGTHLARWLSHWDISFLPILSLEQKHHQLLLSLEAAGLWTGVHTLGSPGSPAGWPQIWRLHSLCNHVSQLLIINFSISTYISVSYWFQSSRAASRRRQWRPTPVLLPGKSHGRRSLVGCSPWGR